jgi:indolepyruvate ferredoxin oxidoreductase beta subunit
MESEIHGMAQRGGIVMSTIRIGDVHSSMIGKGEADILLGLEPVETYRHLSFACKDTMIVTSTNSVYPFTVTSGDESYPEVSELISNLKDGSDNVLTLDVEKKAKENGLPVIVGNIIMLGALAGVNSDFPIPPEKLKETISVNVPSKYVEENLRAFDSGYETAQNNHK